MCIDLAGLRVASQRHNLFDLDHGCIELSISRKLIYFRLCIITVLHFNALSFKGEGCSL